MEYFQKVECTALCGIVKLQFVYAYIFHILGLEVTQHFRENFLNIAKVLQENY